MPAIHAASPANCISPPAPTASSRLESTTAIGSFTGRTTLSRIGQRMPTQNGCTTRAPRGRSSTADHRRITSSTASLKNTTRPPGAPKRRSSSFMNRKVILGFLATTVLPRITPSIHLRIFLPITVPMSCHCPRRNRVSSKPRLPISSSTVNSPTTTQAAMTSPE